MPKIFVSTLPFGEFDPTPIQLLEQTGWPFRINPTGRKLKVEEVGAMAQDCDGLIAGTENIGMVLKKAENLKIVARVGIGLDSVPLSVCREKGVVVAYTPDAVTHAVVEFTISLMISLLRKVGVADKEIRKGIWKRLQGKRLAHSCIGLIGFGRIGYNVAKYLSGFQPRSILVNDIKDKTREINELNKNYGLNIRRSEKSEIYQKADIVSLHVPYSNKTKNLINRSVFDQFKQDAFLINTSRGGIVNEVDLYRYLKYGGIGGAAIDVFDEEPYKGPLIELDNVLLTQHMGSCSFDCRSTMEIEATQEIIRFFKNQPLKNEVPEEEYQYQSETR